MIMQANKIMTRDLIAIGEKASVFEADNLMREKRIRHLAVIDPDQNIVGVISQRDLNYLPDAKRVSVDMVMSSPVHFVPEDANLRQVVFHMLEKKISCLLVADKEDNATGIVTTDDLLWYLASLLSPPSEKKTLINPSNQILIGEVANELSQMGI